MSVPRMRGRCEEATVLDMFFSRWIASELGQPPVHDNLRTGHKGRVFTREEQRRPRNLVGFSETMQRYLRFNTRGRLSKFVFRQAKFAVERRVDRTGTYGVDANAARGKLRAEGTHEGTYGRLRCREDREPGSADSVEKRRRYDNAATLAEKGRSLLDGEENALEVD